MLQTGSSLSRAFRAGRLAAGSSADFFAGRFLAGMAADMLSRLLEMLLYTIKSLNFLPESHRQPNVTPINVTCSAAARVSQAECRVAPVKNLLVAPAAASKSELWPQRDLDEVITRVKGRRTL